MAEMRTEAATLNAEAQNFDRIAQDLGKEKQTVDSTGSSLAGTWQGQAATAFTNAYLEFNADFTKVIQALNNLGDKLRVAGVNYNTTEEANQSAANKIIRALNG